MRDITTHAIQYSGYWHLVRKVGDEWIATDDNEPICYLGAEAKIVDLQTI